MITSRSIILGLSGALLLACATSETDPQIPAGEDQIVVRDTADGKIVESADGTTQLVIGNGEVSVVRDGNVIRRAAIPTEAPEVAKSAGSVTIQGNGDGCDVLLGQTSLICQYGSTYHCRKYSWLFLSAC